MNDSVIIAVEKLGKKYRIKHQAERQRYTALRDVMAEKTKGLFKMLKFGKQKTEIEEQQKTETAEDKTDSRKQKVEIKNDEGQNKFQLSQFPISALPASEDFWALRDVSFDVRQGEVVGIIGLPREIGIQPPTHWMGKCTRNVFERAMSNSHFTGGRTARGKARCGGEVRNQKSEVRSQSSDLRLPASAFRPRMSLLEVGTGFHPELTGRENIFLNGAILGMSRVEIKKKFDEIAVFAIFSYA